MENVRPAVYHFALAMERKLRLRDRTHPDWSANTIPESWGILKAELDELREEVYPLAGGTDPALVAAEAVDCAIGSLIVWDTAGRGGAPATRDRGRSAVITQGERKGGENPPPVYRHGSRFMGR